MSASQIAILRWVLLGAAALGLLQATVLFQFSQRTILARWVAANGRAGATFPPLLRDRRVQRAWPLVMAAVLLGLWWFFGTPAGAGWLGRMH